MTTAYTAAENESRQYRDGHGKLKGDPILFCKICRGLHDSCFMCRRVQDVRNLFPELVAHAKYVRKTWEKLKQFRMATSGCDTLDAECRRMFGAWLILGPDELLIRLAFELTEKYKILMTHMVRLLERRRFEILDAYMTQKLNSELARLIMDENLIPKVSHDQVGYQGLSFRSVQ